MGNFSADSMCCEFVMTHIQFQYLQFFFSPFIVSLYSDWFNLFNYFNNCQFSSPPFLQIKIELLDGLRPGSPKPGHIQRIETPNASTRHDDDPVVTQRFLKINVRHITDGQGVVGGVLLVTPNAVMFDPNVSDPLVLEHGPESYGVIAPMDLVVNAAIFHDIAHMRVGGGELK